MTSNGMDKGGSAASGRPTELAITLAALPGRYGDHEGWVGADEVRHRLTLLGFAPTTQQVAAWLGRMSRVECPWVERRSQAWRDEWEYRVTRFGRTDISNQLASLRPLTSWLPVYRDAFNARQEGSTS